MTSRLSAMNVIFVAIVAQLDFVTGIGNTAIEAVAAADIIYAAHLGHEGLAPAFTTGSHGPLASVLSTSNWLGYPRMFTTYSSAAVSESVERWQKRHFTVPPSALIAS
jgi:hypothetical protein